MIWYAKRIFVRVNAERTQTQLTLHSEPVFYTRYIRPPPLLHAADLKHRIHKTGNLKIELNLLRGNTGSHRKISLNTLGR